MSSVDQQRAFDLVKKYGDAVRLTKVRPDLFDRGLVSDRAAVLGICMGSMLDDDDVVRASVADLARQRADWTEASVKADLDKLTAAGFCRYLKGGAIQMIFEEDVP